VADLGQGWYGFNLSAEDVVERIEKLTVLLEKRGRSRDDVEISVCPYMLPATPETIHAYEDAGVDRVILTVAAGSPDRLSAALDALAALVSG
jgi:alkanesulfonate monooxygenase SsuD/methylene tetrahydromethanopterin reductase-like flavin-dependent oxidoreductase (luciferase family)